VKRRDLRIALAVVITVALLFLILRAIPPGELIEALSNASPLLLGLAVIAAFGFAVARAWRYQLLLGRDRAPSARSVLAITLAAWGISQVMPGPSSDAVFVWQARVRLRTPVAVGIGASLIVRILDGASLLLIALLTASAEGVILPRYVAALATVLAVLFVGLLTALLWDRPRRWILPRLEALPVVGGIVSRIAPALEELGTGSRTLLLIASTAAARIFTGLQYLALFAAIGHPLSFWQVWFALSVRTLLLAFPIQGIGGLGTTQLWWTAALTLLGFPFDDALAASLAVHILDLAVSLPQGAAGWLALYLGGGRPSVVAVSGSGPAEAEDDEPRPRVISGGSSSRRD
jgi:uncharacterized membrane protein YbhN (UPF0104 family)